jgi:hypothetical protein
MHLFVEPQPFWYTYDFVYIILFHILMFAVYSYLPALRTVRYAVHTLILEVNNNYLHSTEYLWVLLLVFYTTLMFSLSACFGMPSILCNPIIVIILMTFFWSICVSLGLLKNKLGFFSNLSPAGVPGAMKPFMVILELVLLLLKPVLFAFRVCLTNVIGHLILLTLKAMLPYRILHVLLSGFLILEIAKSVMMSYLLVISVALLLASCTQLH